MPGNEVDVALFLFRNLHKLTLPHIGIVDEVGFPSSGPSKYSICIREEDLSRLSSDDSRKKADIYVNGKGISIKQKGSQFDFNRLQRAEMEELFKTVGISDIKEVIDKLEFEVRRFHTTKGIPRDRPWRDSFSEEDFYKLLEYLMMKGSPNVGISKHPAEYVMEAPTRISSGRDIDVYTFKEYFDKYKDHFKVSIRRSWLGQKSGSEHGRARSLISKPGNLPFVFDTVSGKPNTGWREECPKDARRTAYYLMLSKV